jgi:hypothetical protein
MEVSMARKKIQQEKRGPGWRYPMQERMALLAGFQRFSGSLYEYSKRVGVPLVTLRRWQRRDEHVSHDDETGGFVEFEVRQADARFPATVEVELPGGVRLRFLPPTDAGYIGRLARELDR